MKVPYYDRCQGGWYDSGEILDLGSDRDERPSRSQDFADFDGGYASGSEISDQVR